MGKIKAIVDAAQTLFAEKGYENTPVAEIAKIAGVAGGTIIYHFKNKENLLFIVTWRILYSLYKSTLKGLGPSPDGLQAAVAFVDTFFDSLESHRNEFQLMLKNTAYDTLDVDAFPNADLKLLHLRYLQLLEDALDRGQRDGSINIEDVHATATIIYATLVGAARMHISHGEPLGVLHKEAATFVRARLTLPA
ncbi:transcriptional regulator, TetR family [Desulfovibrio sp. X2]|uniref:TetR/AcrR family transcriptional regulator n=1 Tax=Desulfovibrio sp. X2 TaxID=941449 RepID=UPI000358BF34|nr:TetR/AcrR family transcriptional regulator [Desulfovibrio sp. X2]EPR42650.1 transcriptional regulator, TetR family [Desulfovibrio sp. X2]